MSGPTIRFAEDLSWMDQAKCTGSGVNFFPGKGEDTKAAHALCRRCPVRSECLEFALITFQNEGIWGDTSARERRRIRRQRRVKAT